MAQFPVVGYALLVSTNPPPAPGAPPVEFKTGVSIQFVVNGPFQPLPIRSTEEFMAVVALIQTPGRLLYDPQAATLEKIQP